METSLEILEKMYSVSPLLQPLSMSMQNASTAVNVFFISFVFRIVAIFF